MLVFFITWVGIFILSIFLIPLLSTVKITVKDLTLKNDVKPEETKVNLDDIWDYLDIDFQVIFSIHFLNLIKVLQYTFDKKKAKKMHLDRKIKELNFEKVKKEVELDFDKEMRQTLKKLRYKVKEFNLCCDIGTKDAILTSYLVATIATVLSIILAIIIKKVDPKNHMYRVSPIYGDRNLVDLKLNCIFFTRMVHIMYVIFIFLRKRRVKVYERTSNRGAYDDSDGQHSRYGGRKYNHRGANTGI